MNSPDASSASKRLYHRLLLAAVYFIAGKLALLLAIPPGYSSPVWPSAGIALAALLMYGRGLWPGIFIGSFALNAWTAYNGAGTPAISELLVLPMVIGAGASLQAVAGEVLIRRYSVFPVPAERVEDNLKLMLIGGPVSCLVSAATGVLALIMTGAVPMNTVAVNWLTWWMGDTLGVIIILPFISAWVMAPGEAGSRSRRFVILPICITLVLVLSLFLIVRSDAWQQIKLEFDKRADRMAQTVISEVQAHIDVLYSLEGLFNSSLKVERQEFHLFIYRLLNVHRDIQALEWIPRVRHSEKTLYEDEAHRDGFTDFRISEVNAEGQRVPTQYRKEYYPAYYVEPYKGNENALGFDLSSNPDCLEAMNRSREQAGPAATSRFMFVQETGRHYGIIVFVPVFNRPSPPAPEYRQEALKGFALVVFRIEEFIVDSLSIYDQNDVHYWLIDETAPEGNRLLFTNSVQREEVRYVEAIPAPSADAFSWQTTFDVAGRKWSLLFSPSPEALAGMRQWEAWGVLTGGLILTSLLGLLLLTITGRNAVTERLVRERTSALRESEGRHRAILDNTVDGIITINEHAIVLSFNPAAENIFGYSASDVIGNNVNMLQPEPYHSHHNEYIQNYLRTGKAGIIGSRHEFIGQRKDGTTFPLDMSVSEVQLADRRLFTGIIRDITERKKTEDALKESERKFRQIAGTINDIFWMTSPDGSEILYISPGFEKLWGISSEALYNDSTLWIKQILSDDRRHVQAMFTHDRLTKGEFDVEFRILNAKDEVSWIHAVGFPILNDKGEVYRISGVASDITKFKEIDQLKSMFIASMSHELRTPLNSIIGFTGMTLQGLSGELNAEQRDNLERVYKSAKHLLSLISDVIDISKIEAGRIDIYPEEFPLDELVNEAVETVRPQLKEKGLTLEMGMMLSVKMQTDRKRLLQCLLNMLSNAVKYTETGTITVSASDAGKDVELSVSDTGIGIAEEEIPKLFKAFERLQSQLNIKAGGTGLGLYLTKKIAADFLGGIIEIESEKGRGSTFRLRIQKDIKAAKAAPVIGEDE